MPDKQIMFEAAEVLDEVLKAVEQKKKALRLDFTPYRLYEMYKKKLPKKILETEESMDISDDEATKAKKKEMVKHFMEQQNHRMANEKEQRRQDKRAML